MKKFLTILLTVVLTAAVAITGTVAYLTSEDSDVNVMTLGNVKIAQHEYERVVNADGTFATDTIDNVTSYVLKEFTQNKPIVPSAINTTTWEGWDWDTTVVRMTQVGSYGGMQVFKSASNAQDKFVTVKNTGLTDAYVRTLVAIEVGSADPDLIGTSYHQTWTKNVIGTIEIAGTNYYVLEYVYAGGQLDDGSWRHENGVLPAGETTYPNLSQVYLKSEATNEDCEAIDGNGNGKLDILVLSQAVQADGFDDAQTALDTAFGEVNANNAKLMEAFLGSLNYTSVSTAEELETAIETAAEGETTTIVLANDVVADIVAPQNKNGTIIIDGNGHDFSGVIVVDGKSAQEESATFTIRNVNFVADSISADACIRLGDGTTATRYTCNVTIENCTFDVPGAVGVKSYTGGDKNVVIKDCEVSARCHSLAQFANVEEGLTITDCKVYSKNGINLNNTLSLVMTDCEFDVRGYAVRSGVNGTVGGADKNLVIENCTLKSDCEAADDAVIVLRDSSKLANLVLTGTTLEGTRDILK